MANTLNGNTIYIDTQAVATPNKNVRLQHIIVTSTSATAVLELVDATTTTIKKIKIQISAANQTQSIELPKAIVFPNGIHVGTLTNCVATLIIES